MTARPSRSPLPGPALRELLREWRRRRGLSQLQLALQAGISQRHLSFLELGRARASRDMVLRIAEALALPLRDRNRLLLTVGFAPEYAERPLDDPALESALQAVQRVLAGHEPYPAFAVDRHWSLLLANAAVAPVLFAGAAPHLLAPPINILRLTLHPDGLAPRIRNLPAWRAALLSYLQRQVESTGDVELGPLLDELRGYPLPGQAASLPTPSSRPAAVFLPLELASPAGELSLMSTLTTFATATDITLEEVTLECFFPAERTTADRLRSLVRA